MYFKKNDGLKYFCLNDGKYPHFIATLIYYSDDGIINIKNFIFNLSYRLKYI